MSALAKTPDLFADDDDFAPRTGVCTGPSSSHPVSAREENWRNGWWFRSKVMSQWMFVSYEQDVLNWIRDRLAKGPVDYMDLLKERRAARIDEQLGDGADIVRSHCRYLVLTGEIIERKRYLGAPDPNSPGYRGWHPYFELSGRGT